MSAWTHVWDNAINRMNNSVMRANEYADGRKLARDKQVDVDNWFANVARQKQLEDWQTQPAAATPAAAPSTQIPALAYGTGSAYQKGPGMTSGGTPESGGQDKHWTNRLRKLMTDPKAFERTPGFKAALDTGTQAIQRSFAARGMGNSGNVLAELMKYGTGLASQEYGSQVNRLSRLAQDEQGNPDYWKNTQWGAA